jgi:ABC-type Fe3+ transport system substrate-binding protein
MGIDETYLDQLQQQGLGKNVRVLAPETDAGVRISQQSGAVSLINNPPHPNAAKVFLNWLLSKDGQSAWSRITQENSRRLDVTEGPRDTRPDPNRRYHGDVAREDLLYLPNKCVELGRELVR